MTRRNKPLAALVAVAVLATIAGCSAAETGSESGSGSLVVWTLEEQADRLAKAQAAADDFTAATGISVELVGVNEDQFPQLITAAAAAGTLPDVVGALPLSAVRTMSSNDLVNTDVTGQILDDLDPSTFSKSAVDLTQEDGAQIAIPSDGFPLSVIYRKDLFAAAGLPAPETYDDLVNAAKTLNSPEIAGFVAGDSASTSYTQQVFEFFALANGCDLVNDSGDVTLDSPECVKAFSTYGELVHDYSVPGAMDSTSTKTTYMGGKAAITMWASFILDEMAGLVNDAMPTCPECAADPKFIAENSGFVTSFAGPDGSPVSGGDVTSWVVTADADADAAKQFVEYFMDDAYLQWLSQAPEGKFPTRSGTADDPQKFVEGWKDLETGVDTKAKLADVYSPEVLAALQDGVDNFSRWGFKQGQGALLGAILAELPIPKAIGALQGGEVDGPGAADQAQKAVQAIQDSIE
ncbi:MAG: extracellular solute-binding protein family 1 [Rhodoglobus sp.]|nr:extracellular solute-binding protein family 1 [Rhodoglobus sp.]